ncbi:MAG: PolC-type DNA polymerase III, partial [Candidatus Kapaibacteriota bacterium]
MTNLDVSLGDVRFVVVDVESTGGTSGEHRLIEIAMIVLQDGMIVDRHASLVNPHESIPDFIQRMTGITEAMVEGAPEEAEAIAPVLAALDHPHAVFVAHNVGFDWGFVQRAIERQGRMVPPIARLCTVKLSRR